MVRVILQPAGSKASHQDHYRDTIENPIDIHEVRELLSETDYEIVQEYYPDGIAAIWGVKPGHNDLNVRKWDKIQQGDIALFARFGKIISSGIITHKLINKELSEHLWNVDDDEGTWEYIYFLDEIKKLDIPYSVFNPIAGYKPNNVIQGFSVLDETKSFHIVQQLDLFSDTYFPEVSDAEYERAINPIDPDTALDVEVQTQARTEQNRLRRSLFTSKKSKCGICNREFPIKFLVAAHIKKRAFCTDDEKRDIENIVMPMCIFGCDALFEKGVIGVQDGYITELNFKDLYAAS